MKKIIAFLFIFSFIFMAFIDNKSEIQILQGYSGECEFYCQNIKKYSNFITNVTQSGQYLFVSSNLSSAKKVYNDLENVKGFKITFNDKDIDLSNLNIKFLESEIVENMQIKYGFSNYFKRSIFMKGKKINVQIAVREDSLILGTPLILSSY